MVTLHGEYDKEKWDALQVNESYKNKIQSLRVKLQTYERRHNDMEGINEKNGQLTCEVDQLKLQLSTLKKGRHNDVEGINEKNAQLTCEVDQLKLKMATLNEEYDKERRDALQVSESHKEEMKSLRWKMETYESEGRDNEMERLNEKNKQLTCEVDQLKLQVAILQKEKRDLFENGESLKNKFQILVGKLQKCKEKGVSEEKHELLKSEKMYRARIENLEKELVSSRQENHRQDFGYEKSVEDNQYHSLRLIQGNDSRNTFTSIQNDSTLSPLNLEHDNAVLKKKAEKLSIMLEDKCLELTRVTNEKNCLLADIEKYKSVSECPYAEVENRGDQIHYGNEKSQEELIGLREKYREMLDTRNTDHMKMAELETQFLEADHEAERYKIKLNKINAEAQEIFVKNKQLLQSIDVMNEDKSHLLNTIDELKQKIGELENRIESTQNEKNNIIIEESDARNETKKAYEDIKRLNQTIEDNASEKKELEDILRKSNYRISSLENELKTTKTKVEGDNDILKKYRDEIKLFQNTISKLRFENDDLEVRNHKLYEMLSTAMPDGNFSSLKSYPPPSTSLVNQNDRFPNHITLNRQVNELLSRLETMKDALNAKDEELKCLNVDNKSLKLQIESMLSPVDEGLNYFSSKPNDSKQQNLEREVKRLKLENEGFKESMVAKDNQLSKRLIAMNNMKDKIKTLSNDSDMTQLTELKHQNVAYKQQVQDYIAEMNNLRGLNKELIDQSAQHRRDKNNLQAEMDNMKRLNFSRTVSHSSLNENSSPSALDPLTTDLLQKVPSWWRAHMVHDN